VRKKAKEGRRGIGFFGFFGFFGFVRRSPLVLEIESVPPPPASAWGPCLRSPRSSAAVALMRSALPCPNSREQSSLDRDGGHAWVQAASVFSLDSLQQGELARPLPSLSSSSSSFSLLLLPPHQFHFPLPFHPKTLIRFSPRHNSLTPAEEAEMVAALGFSSLDELIDATVPASIRAEKPLDLGEYTEGFTESEFLEKFK
jgi:hypothetical protein